jgi:hypothetical protein
MLFFAFSQHTGMGITVFAMRREKEQGRRGAPEWHAEE